MVSMPMARAAMGELIWTSRPWNRMRPSSAGYTPEMTLIRVDLPAPLSPSRPTTSPAFTPRLTSFTAVRPPKRLTILRTSSR